MEEISGTEDTDLTCPSNCGETVPYSPFENLSRRKTLAESFWLSLLPSSGQRGLKLDHAYALAEISKYRGMLRTLSKAQSKPYDWDPGLLCRFHWPCNAFSQQSQLFSSPLKSRLQACWPLYFTQGRGRCVGFFKALWVEETQKDYVPDCDLLTLLQSCA